VVLANSEQDLAGNTALREARFHLAFDEVDAGEFSVLFVWKTELTYIQYLIWPSVENMNANPEWLMPSAGKQEVTPYDILIDLVPWFVLLAGTIKLVQTN
jgi:hypothetical protein